MDYNHNFRCNENNDKKIEKLGTEIEKILTDLGELSLKICKKTKTLNDCKVNDDAHEKTFKWIQKNKNELMVCLDKHLTSSNPKLQLFIF